MNENLNESGLSRVYVLTNGQAEEVANGGKKFIEAWDIDDYKFKAIKVRVYEGNWCYNDLLMGIQPHSCSLFLRKEDAEMAAATKISRQIERLERKIEKHRKYIDFLRRIEA